MITGAENAQEKATTWHDAVERMNCDSTIAAETAFERGETAGSRQFLWGPLAACVREALVAAPGTRFGSSILSGYGALVRVAKLWEAERRWADQAILAFHRKGRRGIVRREWREAVNGILEAQVESQPFPGGRGGTVRALTSQGAVIVRTFRRGGAMRWAGETYFGFRARPFHEFWLLLRARRRGLPVPDPIAAVVMPYLGIAYRGLLMMSEIGGVSVWEYLREHPAADITLALAHSLHRLHDGGLDHPDLNLGNILVLPGDDETGFAFVDLDRAHLREKPLAEAARRRMLARIRRSARRLDPAGSVVPEVWLDRLEKAYWASS